MTVIKDGVVQELARRAVLQAIDWAQTSKGTGLDKRRRRADRPRYRCRRLLAGTANGHYAIGDHWILQLAHVAEARR